MGRLMDDPEAPVDEHHGVGLSAAEGGERLGVPGVGDAGLAPRLLVDRCGADRRHLARQRESCRTLEVGVAGDAGHLREQPPGQLSGHVGEVDDVDQAGLEVGFRRCADRSQAGRARQDLGRQLEPPEVAYDNCPVRFRCQGAEDDLGSNAGRVPHRDRDDASSHETPSRGA